MKESEYEGAMRELAYNFFAAPAVILLGMFFVGAIIDSLTQQKQSTFGLLFSGIGGIPSIVAYYVKRYKQHNQQADQFHALKMRLAKGEIKPEEFEKIKKALLE